jgi:hypothetical protein
MPDTNTIRQEIHNIMSNGALSGGKGKTKQHLTVKTVKAVKAAKPASRKKVPIGYKCNQSIVNGVVNEKCSMIYDNKLVKKELKQMRQMQQHMRKEMQKMFDIFPA